MFKRERKSGTLADTISNILNVAPSSIDPEDDAEDSKAKVTEGAVEDEVDETLLSEFRKKNIDFLEDVDKKYASRKASRKDLKDSDEDWETDEELANESGNSYDAESVDISSDAEDSDRDQRSSDDFQNDEGDGNSTESNEDDGNSTESIEDDGNSTENDEGDESDSGDDNFNQMNNDLNSQVKKGTCVRNQLNIWENLLEVRIQLQKCLVTANKLPQKDKFKEITTQTPGNFHLKVDETKKNVTDVLNKLSELQLLMLKQYPESKKLFSAQKQTEHSENVDEIPSDTDEEIPSETDDENDKVTEETESIPCKRRKLSDYETEIKNNHDIYSPYRNSVIQKWNDRTRIAVVKNKSNGYLVLNQIDHILNDKQKLVKRTQIKRSKYEILGKNNSCEIETPVETNEENDVEIFDDDDFYHQLLRELIAVKTADVTDAVQLSRQWIQLQDTRSKMKRNIDTRATKGRKIRYAVHSKLVNFMAPVDSSSCTEKAQTELYNSLFGKNQSVIKT